MAYQFTSVRVSKLKNLLNVKKADAIERVRLEINKNIFDAALIPGKNTGTKGYHLYPAKLERALKDTVQKHSAELRAFCTSANYSHVKGGKYTSAIRPLFNLLIREVTGLQVHIDGQNYLPVMKPIKTYAQTCCESTFYTKRGDKQFKRQMAVEHLTYALEVLKLLWADGLQRLEIKDYCFTDTHLKITLRNHFGSKKAGLEALPDRQV